MLADAERLRFDLVLFWALDRFSREGIRETIHYLQRLDACGVRFKMLGMSSRPPEHLLRGDLA